MRQLLQAQNPSFKNSEIMILPNSDSEKEVKEETPSIPQVIIQGPHIICDILDRIKINCFGRQGLNLGSNEFVSHEK